MLSRAFPGALREDLNVVLNILPSELYSVSGSCVTQGTVEYDLDGETVCFPYRIYLSEPDEATVRRLTKQQQLLLFCIYTRSHDGYLREKYANAILCRNFPVWCIPYLVKLCDEYVVEILAAIYEYLKGRDNRDMQEFCRRNREATRKSCARMVSYWNEYYRRRNPDLQTYIGRILFRDCLGYDLSFKF